MLVDFTLENYGSFRDSQRLSLIASKRSKHARETAVDIFPRLLPVAALFGANASGKSTIARALDFFQYMVLASPKLDEDTEFDVTPFLFDQKFASRPTKFEISFIVDTNFYRYGFAVSKDRIHEEWMVMVPKGGRTNDLFRRQYNSETGDYTWHINEKTVKGAKHTWKLSTMPYSLFLSVAFKMGAEVFKEPYNWFKQDLRILHEDQSILESFTARAFTSDSSRADKILQLLRSADIPVDKITVQEREIPEDILKNIPENVREEFKRDYKYEVKFRHLTDAGDDVYLDLERESGGVQKLFALAGPIMEVLETGKVFVIDELHNHLHPHLLEFVIHLFQSEKINKNNAQLIITSHDVTVMSPAILDLDEIWLIDKTPDRASRLSPLSSYKPRDGLFWRAYMQGKYGAVPKVNLKYLEDALE